MYELIAPIVSKTALSEQKQDALNTSALVVAPEMQYNRLNSISHTFFTLLPTKGGVAGDVAQRDACTIITLKPCIVSQYSGLAAMICSPYNSCRNFVLSKHVQLCSSRAKSVTTLILWSRLSCLVCTATEF